MADIQYTIDRGSIVEVAGRYGTWTVTGSGVDEEGDLWYDLDKPNGDSTECPAEDITRVVMSGEAARNRELPSKNYVAQLIARECFVDNERVAINEADTRGGAVTLYGETNEGLEFYIEIPVDAIKIGQV